MTYFQFTDCLKIQVKLKANFKQPAYEFGLFERKKSTTFHRYF